MPGSRHGMQRLTPSRQAVRAVLATLLLSSSGCGEVRDVGLDLDFAPCLVSAGRRGQGHGLPLGDAGEGDPRSDAVCAPSLPDSLTLCLALRLGNTDLPTASIRVLRGEGEVDLKIRGALPSLPQVSPEGEELWLKPFFLEGHADCTGYRVELACTAQPNCLFAFQELRVLVRGEGPLRLGYGYRLGLTDCNVECNRTPLPGQPPICWADEQEMAEVCDGLDNDCNGRTDEGFDQDGDGFTSCGGDCDDLDPEVRPDAGERCNLEDDDCDGETDEGFDGDHDGFSGCVDDCDDGDAAVHPGASEWCNFEDDDCDGETDEGFDRDGDGFTSCGGDCDDSSRAVYPGNDDPCNGVDDDCDGLDGIDADEDGFTSCEEPGCDEDALRHPGAMENPGNGIDENCDGLDVAPVCNDQDGDGWCAFLVGCDPLPARCIVGGWDCHDLSAGIHPGAEEVCDELDNDCNGATDEGFDRDEDGVTVCQGDCDDGNPDQHPGLPELCDGLDNDCNGEEDDGLPGCLHCDPFLTGRACNEQGCTPGTWTCLDVPGGQQLACEPELHLVDTLDCGSFRREGQATYVEDATGLLAVAGPDVLRLQYDDQLRQRTFFLEQARTNLVLQSKQLTAPTWAVYPNTTHIDVQPLDFEAPDGQEAQGYKFNQGMQSLNHYNLCPLPAGTQLSFSLYMRQYLDPFPLEIATKDWAGTAFSATPVWTRVQTAHLWRNAGAQPAQLILRYALPREGSPPATVALWGVQAEEGPFASSYIPTTGDVGIRGDDQVSVDERLLGETSGTLAVWLRPLFPETFTGDPVPLLEVGDALRCEYAGDTRQVRCTAGWAEAALPAGTLPVDRWSFLAVSWDAATGLTLTLGHDGALTRVRNVGALILPAPEGETLHPLPHFSHSRDLRLWSRALRDEELQSLYEADQASYP